jgi:hypothetical protein
VRLSNQTIFERNSAPEGQGSTISLSGDGTLHYTLLAPPGRWLNIQSGLTFELTLRSEDLDFPYACSAGVVGSALAEEQMGPGCSKLW